MATVCDFDEHVVLSNEQISEFKETFSLFDKTADGSIKADELGLVMRALGVNPTEEYLRKAISETDGDKITFDDFVKLMSEQLQEEVSEEDLIEAFKVFDKDETGTISCIELRHIMTHLGDRLRDEEVDEMIREADCDNTGVVHYVAFVKMMLAK